MQIKEIVLYGHDRQIRRLKFRLGEVNVISGASRTGKSALAAIVDYCLTDGSIDVPVGVIRDRVAWYALLLSFPIPNVSSRGANRDHERDRAPTCSSISRRT